MILPPPPGPNPNNIGDQLARALAMTIAMRQQQQDREYQKEKMKFDLAHMAHQERIDKQSERDNLAQQERQQAEFAFKMLTGQSNPVNDITNGVSAVQGLPTQSNALAQAVPAGPTSLEDFMAMKGPELGPIGRVDTSAAVPVGQLPEIPVQISPGGPTTTVRPRSREDINQNNIEQQKALAEIAATKAGAVADATNEVKNPKEVITPAKAAALGLPKETIGMSLDPREQKMAADASKNKRILDLRETSIKDREKARQLAAERPGAIKSVQTQDENGLPVTQLYKVNPNTGDVEVVHQFAKPLGLMEQRLVDTNVAIVNTAEKVKEDLQDPALRALIGPLATRATNLKEFIGILPPEAGTLKADLHALSLAIPGAHTLRSKEAAKAVEEFLGQPGTPELMAAKLDGLMTFPLEYINVAGKGATGLKTKKGPSSDPLGIR